MEGVLTAGQLSEEQMVALAGLGYESFVSLREADEGGSGWEEDFAAEKGIHFVRLPIAGADGIDEAHARKLDELMAAEARPMVLYCGSSNRVGALLVRRRAALHLFPVGLPPRHRRRRRQPRARSLQCCQRLASAGTLRTPQRRRNRRRPVM